MPVRGGEQPRRALSSLFWVRSGALRSMLRLGRGPSVDRRDGAPTVGPDPARSPSRGSVAEDPPWCRGEHERDRRPSCGPGCRGSGPAPCRTGMGSSPPASPTSSPRACVGWFEQYVTVFLGAHAGYEPTDEPVQRCSDLDGLRAVYSGFLGCWSRCGSGGWCGEGPTRGRRSSITRCCSTSGGSSPTSTRACRWRCCRPTGTAGARPRRGPAGDGPDRAPSGRSRTSGRARVVDRCAARQPAGSAAGASASAVLAADLLVALGAELPPAPWRRSSGLDRAGQDGGVEPGAHHGVVLVGRSSCSW